MFESSNGFGGSMKVKTIKKSNINFMKSTAAASLGSGANNPYNTNQQSTLGYTGLGMSNFNTGNNNSILNKRPITESQQHRAVS